MAYLGRAALLLAFGLVAYALVAGSYAAWKRRRRLAHSAQNALLAAFPVTLVAAVLLLVALGRRDMTFVYVWQHTSHELPLGYALSAFWGGQEGSLLLWLLVLTGYAGLAVWLNRRSRDLIAWTVPVFGPDGVRRKADVSLTRARGRERVNLGLDSDRLQAEWIEREPPKRQQPQGVEYRSEAQGRIAS